jgi:hypothetical protein
MGSQAFDITQHHRDRTRRAEQRADGLERQLAHAIRLLAITAAAATHDPIGYLQKLDKPEPTIDELAQLLRETNPAPAQAAA